MHNNTKKKLNSIKKYIQRNYKNWVKEYPNLIGAYPGEKITSGEYTGRYSIVFMVSKKQKKPAKAIPKHFELVVSKKGKKKVPSDVIKSKRIIFRTANLADKIKRKSLNDFGSNGIFLRKGQRIYACTNAHVLLPDMIDAGQTYFFKPINQQIQPTVSISNRQGETFDAYLQEGVFDGIDAAIARMDDPADVGNRLPGFGRPTGIIKIDSSDEGLFVQMAGFVTGASEGNVENAGLTISTPIPGVFLHDLIETSIFSRKGDSGSPVFTNTLKIAGIVLGGFDDAKTYIVPIDQILKFFQCDLFINF